MKKASFKAVHVSSQGTFRGNIYGDVTLKNDGRVSISIQNRNYNSGNANAFAKKIAMQIVESDFNHPAIIGDVQSTDASNNIVEIIRKETEQLKNALIEKTIDWANQSFISIKNNYELVSAMDWESKCQYFGIELTDDKKNVVDSYYNRKNYNKSMDQVSKWFSIIDKGLENYVSKSVKNAENHYENSLMKLVSRINQKGIVADNMKLVSGYVGINLELTLSDGNNSVNARTIWAAQDSELVTPHYRYLIN